MSMSRTDTAAVSAMLAWWGLCAVLVLTLIIVGWRYITTDTALYELESGEYLACTREEENTLECEVTHR